MVALTPDTQLAEFRIKKVLGRGGFGITYLAHDNNLHKDVAIKEYFPTHLAYRDATLCIKPITEMNSDENIFQWGLSRVIDEARVTAKFDHPNLVRIHRYFEQHGTAYIVLEFVSGQPLRSKIATAQQMNESQFRPILTQLIDGLSVVHEADTLHRDIKPDNIILRSDGQPVLIDFGAARQKISLRATAATGYFSAGYTPIEQFSANGKMGPWTDIYALAATAYHALVGKPPIPCSDRFNDDPLVPAATAAKDRASQNFLKAIDWGLAMKTQDRPQSLQQWQQAFDKDIDSLTSIIAKNKQQSTELPDTVLLDNTDAAETQLLNANKDALSSNSPLVSANRKARSTKTILLALPVVVLIGIAGFVGYRYVSINEQQIESNVQISTAMVDQKSENQSSDKNTIQIENKIENRDFAKAVYIDTPEAYELYLRLHPDGKNADVARAALNQ